MNGMQTSSPPQKELFWFFGPNSFVTVWNEWKTKNYNICFLSYCRQRGYKRCAIIFLFESGQIYRKDADWSGNDFLVFFCTTHSFWDVVDFSNDCVHNFQVFLPALRYNMSLVISLWAQLRTALEPLSAIVVWWSEGFQGAVQFGPMMPRDTILSDRCCFIQLGRYTIKDKLI